MHAAFLLLTLVSLGALLAPPASAQAYRCNADGRVYYSERPCPGASTRLNAYGSRPISTPTPYSAPLPAAGKMQDHVKYLSPACASIAEAIRTAPTRGVRSDTIAGLREEYQQKCQYEDLDARRQASQEKADQSREQLAQRDAVARDRRAVQLRADQCAAMRDVIGTKRAREAALNATEVAALRSLEQTYNERCIAQ
ncbi:MAG: DUF4124 domain-containing protein [Burkholderiaceae bacterium]|nr:DUF4124 domain-containing protein [Burkholderiaceae bacterium]